MKFSLTWLKDHLDTDADAATIAETLTAIGIEVEGVEDPAEALAGFRVARVLSAAPHPQADKLQVLSVDTGEGAPLQVVCGAPNARAGLVGVLGTAGARVPASGMELRKSAIRGVESNGMMCSSRELGLGEDHDGIIELPGDAPVGAAFADYRGVEPVFDVAITPNRPDCMGVYGIARDLAAAGLGTLRKIPADSVAGSYACPVEIRTEDREGCPAFFGRVVRGVRNGTSPDWMQARLRSAGQRPISALVDITNYIMLTYGRPAHAYDLAKLDGAVVARRAREGEAVLALNGKEYELDPQMTVIADDRCVHDIAGIMGGEHAGCSEDTTDVLLEIAYFDPESIAATGRKLNLTSDARSRFERGVDPQFLSAGLDLLTRLILETCGGEASHAVRAGEPPKGTKEVPFDPALAESLGGVAVPAEEQKRILGALGFTIAPLPFRGGVGGGGGGSPEAPRPAESPHPNPSPEGEGLSHPSPDGWIVTAPPWRPDIDGAPDIVEEVIRIHGLGRIDSVPLPRTGGVARPTATPEQKMERRLRRAAAGRGLNEAVTWSFLPNAEAAAFAVDGQQPWQLTNPISEDMKAMRPSLLPGLLAASRRNLDRGASSVRLFELGRRYLRGPNGASDERLTLAAVLAGEKQARGWASGKAQAFNAYDAKAEALALLAEAGVATDKLQVMGEAGPQFHPGQSATLRLGPKNVLGRFGMLHPATQSAFDIESPVSAVELFLDAIPARKAGMGFARAPYAPPALQAVTRDFAFLVDAELPAGDLLRTVRGADKQNIMDVRIFDIFQGAGIPEGQKSIAIEVTLQPLEKTYTEENLKAISDRIVAAAAKLRAELRG